VFLMLKYTDITQITYVQSWTITEIMAREKCGLPVTPRTVRLADSLLGREGSYTHNGNDTYKNQLTLFIVSVLQIWFHITAVGKGGGKND
jgi:hypothetical protein